MSQNPETVARDLEARQNLFTQWSQTDFEPPARADYEKNGSLKPTYNTALAVLAQFDWGYAFNELDQSYVLRGDPLPWPSHYDRELNDDTLRVIRNRLLLTAGLELSKEDVREACLSLCRANPFSPVVEFLATVELKWDGVKRIDRWLTTYLSAPDNPYTNAVGRLFLLGAVARAKCPGTKFDQMMILEGEQGTEKSSALKVLGGPWFGDAELGNVRDKEAAINLCGVWIRELPELTTMDRSDVNDLKAFVSRTEDRYRPPYGRALITVPRRCVFAGTINPGGGGYLIDQTGNRRYWPVTTGVIDLDGLKRDREQLWAEAAILHSKGESLVLAKELWALAGVEQAARQAVDPWADEIKAWTDSVRANMCFTHNGKDGCKTLPGDCMHLLSECFGEDGKLKKIHSRDLLSKCLDLPPGAKSPQHGKRLKNVMASIGGWTYHGQLHIGPLSGIGGYERKP